MAKNPSKRIAGISIKSAIVRGLGRRTLPAPAAGRTGEPGERQNKRRRVKPIWEHLNDHEVSCIVCHLFVAGFNADAIKRHMHDFYGERAFTREMPAKIVHDAARQGMFSFTLRDGRDALLEQRIRDRVFGLDTLEVIQSPMAADIAHAAALAVVRWIEQNASQGAQSIRIGLMGGGTIMVLCRALEQLLTGLPAEVKEAWPHLTFQALVVGNNVREPLEEPAAFFTLLADPAVLPLKKRNFIALRAPVVLKPDWVQHYMDTDEFQTLRAEARSSDIVLVSAGAMDDPHSFLGGLERSASDTWGALRAAGCRGDLGRLPIGANAPMSFDVFYPCSLLEAADLQALVRARKHVMLVAAPCGQCGRDKSAIIHTLLDLRDKDCALFSDLICDSSSARHMPLLTRPPRRP